MNLENYPTGENQEELPEVEVVPLDEPSMEDYPQATADQIRMTHEQIVDEFGAPVRGVVKIHDGVRDTENR